MNYAKKKFFFSRNYIGPLDELENASNCVLGIAPYKRLTYLYDDYLVLVVRVDDLEERYSYADKNGNIKDSELLTWLGASEGVVKKVSNQLNFSNPAYQNTLANMPAITVSNVFQSDGLYFDGSNDFFEVDDDGLSLSLQNFTIITKIRTILAGERRIFTKNVASGGYSYSITQRGGNIYWEGIRISGTYYGLNNDIPYVLNETAKLSLAYDGSKLYRWKNTTQYPDVNTPGGNIDYDSNLLNIGKFSTEYFRGNIKYALIFNSQVDPDLIATL